MEGALGRGFHLHRNAAPTCSRSAFLTGGSPASPLSPPRLTAVSPASPVSLARAPGLGLSPAVSLVSLVLSFFSVVAPCFCALSLSLLLSLAHSFSLVFFPGFSAYSLFSLFLVFLCYFDLFCPFSIFSSALFSRRFPCPFSLPAISVLRGDTKLLLFRADCCQGVSSLLGNKGHLSITQPKLNKACLQDGEGSREPLRFLGLAATHAANGQVNGRACEGSQPSWDNGIYV